MHDAVETRLSAIGAARTRTLDALKEAEQRAAAATRERDELAAALEEVKNAGASDPDVERKLVAAAERIRILELQLFYGDRDLKDRGPSGTVSSRPPR